MFGSAVEQDMDRAHRGAKTAAANAARGPAPETGPVPVLPWGPGAPGPATERLVRAAYGLKDAPANSRAGKAITVAKLVGGGIVAGLTMLGGLYLSRKVAEWRKPASERKHVPFLTFDWEVIIPVIVAIGLGVAAVWLLRKLLRSDAPKQLTAGAPTPLFAPLPSNGGDAPTDAAGNAAAAVSSGSPSGSDPIDEMLAQAEADLAAQGVTVPSLPSVM